MMINRANTKLASVLLFLYALLPLMAQEVQLTLDASESKGSVQPTMYGIFYEDINFAADGGLYAEMVKNRSFEFELPKMGWLEPNSNRHSLNKDSGSSSIILYAGNPSNRNFLRVAINNASGYVLINEGFRGMGVREGAVYNISLQAAKGEGDINAIHLAFIDEEGNELGSATISPDMTGWKEYKARITADRTEQKARLQLRFEGNGTIDLDMVSIFPRDTWKGRENGLRKDLVQLLADLDPGFLRFPGGCIVEGRTLDQRYQWKKTVGPTEDREFLINRWNTEFSHRPAPDYFQSFGLGFFEYFQLAEDLGAEPIPILGCGMACQFNTGELVPLDELDPYIQDAMDLIEFANGGTDTHWGKMRADMGHPEPFNMKYIGIGNEQWGPDYFERYKIFADRIYAKYPDMKIVSTPGPFPEGEHFEYGWEQMRKLKADIADEHFYRSPEWFLENADRYDSYDRNGPKVFAGEYAAHTAQTASPDKKNNWESALAEAAFMTGLERNADVVIMSSYAPLLAHADGWQWTPDLIWFNNLESYGTPNYYVQKLYANNRGTDVLSVNLDGQPLTGQQQLYASAVKDANTNELIIKLVNTGEGEKHIKINLKGAGISSKGNITVLRSPDLLAANSFSSPENITPDNSEIRAKGAQISVDLPPGTFGVLKFPMR